MTSGFFFRGFSAPGLRILYCAIALFFNLPTWAAPAMWEVRAPGGGQVWLFGSIHLCTAQCFPLPDAVIRAFDGAQALALELDPNSAATGARVLERGIYAAGDALDRHLDAGAMAELDTALAKLGMDRNSWLRMRPWMLAQMLVVLSAQSAGMQIEHGIDLWFLARAQAQNKPVLELETADEQIDSMDRLPDAAQQTMLQQSLSYLDAPTMQRAMADLLAAWQSGDAPALAAQIRKDLAGGAESSRIVESVLTRRNAVMAQRIAHYLQDGQQVFVVVGAGHLAGPGSLPEQLASMGYRVIRTR
ncbi:MAG: TraB/GumN family protein [Rhodocyclaceae bacterium]|nr:TraB/GumN family protein [Rhodocyclaceae bacterium]